MAGRIDELADLIGQTVWGRQGAAPAQPQPVAPPNGQPDFSTLGGRAAYLFGANAGLPAAGFQPPPGATPALDDALRANGAMLNTPSAPPSALAGLPAAPVVAPAATTNVPDVSSKGVKAAEAQGIDPRYAALAEAGNHLNAGMMLQLGAIMHPMAMHDQMMQGLYAPAQKRFLDTQAQIAQMPDATERNAAQLKNTQAHVADIEKIFGVAVSPYVQAQAHALNMGLGSLGNPGAVAPGGQ